MALLIHTKEWRKTEGSSTGNSVHVSNTSKMALKAGALPLPSPPSAQGAKPANPTTNYGGSNSKKIEEKVAAVKAYRRANGLCYKCGDKWSPNNHICSSTVPFHMVEELWAIMGDSEEVEMLHSLQTVTQPTNPEEQLLSISKQAVNGTEARKTIRLRGYLGDQEVIMLVDSGSSSSFASTLLAAKLPGIQALPGAVQVKIADGGIMSCSEQVVACPWLCQGRTFYIDLKVLPLACYDVVLGMDWLEENSPMVVKWKQKTLAFDHKGVKVQLQGVLPDVQHCSVITVAQLEALLKNDAVLQLFELGVHSASEVQLSINSEIQKLLKEFAGIFTEPVGLPPQRACDYAIPLLPGAQPFRLRPYRYTPEQKDEIEKQVDEMLWSGVIQHSSSPFASPVLIVRKKDMSWRLCVDYRKLNSYTVKNKFPLPIFDEILDELSGAAVFTKLDHRSGYHQITMRKEDVYKTAFQTHHGHYEYKVMSYGLTGPLQHFRV